MERQRSKRDEYASRRNAENNDATQYSGSFEVPVTI